MQNIRAAPDTNRRWRLIAAGKSTAFGKTGLRARAVRSANTRSSVCTVSGTFCPPPIRCSAQASFPNLRPVAIKYWNSAFRNNIRLVVISAFFIILRDQLYAYARQFSSLYSAGDRRGRHFRRHHRARSAGFARRARCASASSICSPRAYFCTPFSTRRRSALAPFWARAKRQTLQGRRSAIFRGLWGSSSFAGCFFGGFARFSHESGYWDVVGNFSPQNATGTEKDIYSVFLYVKNYYFRSGDYFPHSALVGRSSLRAGSSADSSTIPPQSTRSVLWTGHGIGECASSAGTRQSFTSRT